MREFFSRLKHGLNKTQRRMTDGIRRSVGMSPVVSEELFEEIESGLIGADCGVELAERFVETLRDTVEREGLSVSDQIVTRLKDIIADLLLRNSAPNVETADPPLRITMFVGVNGAGKTTSIGKIGCHYARGGRRVLFAAADTFRAAAAEQLEIWSERANAQLVNSTHGADPAAVAFDAVSAAKSRGIHEVLIDTAGRLQSKSNLMAELAKVRRSVDKALADTPDAVVRVLLVMDATTGQNGLSQAEQFHKAVGVDAIVLTKLDGTARGGIVLAVADRLKLPVEWIGVGETVDDLETFDPQEYVDALFAETAEVR